MLAMGIGFQVPVAILAAVKLGLTTPRKLRKNRRYAILVIAIVAAFLPTIDPVTLLLEMIPLILLYELSILLSVLLVKPRRPGSRAGRRRERLATAAPTDALRPPRQAPPRGAGAPT